MSTGEFEHLTQYGAPPAGFRRAPRAHEDYVSVISGRLTPAEACVWVRGSSNCNHEDDMARYTSASSLRDVGFRVEQKGKRLDHVGVWWDDGEWTEEVQKAFEGTFQADGDNDG